MERIIKGRLTNKKYRDSARDRSCLVCGSSHGVVLHHIRTGTNAGVGRKPDDDCGLFLCSCCHNNVHQGERSFYRKYSRVWGDDVISYAKELYKQYLQSK